MIDLVDLVDRGARAWAAAGGVEWDTLSEPEHDWYRNRAGVVVGVVVDALMSSHRFEAISQAFAAAVVTDSSPTFDPPRMVGMDATRFEAALREAGYEIREVAE